MSILIIVIIFAYLIGSIPFGYIIAKLVKGIDIRTVGSRNIGATNVGRIIGWKWGVFTFLLDALKGAIIVCLAYFVSTAIAKLPASDYCAINNAIWMLIGGIAVILGHLFPIYLRFKGGKGVATAFGVFILMMPRATIIALALWLFLVLLFRYVSIASIVAGISLPISYFLLNTDYKYKPNSGYSIIFITSLVVTLLVILKHIPNIKRLLNGTEPKVSFKKKDETQK